MEPPLLTYSRGSTLGDGLGEILGKLPGKSAIPVGPATSLTVVPCENTMVVSTLGMEEYSRAEEIWVGNNFIDCSPLKSIDAAVISITANRSGPDMQCIIRNEKNFFLLVYYI